MTPPRPETVAAWTYLVTASRVLLERVERALKANGLPSLGWYDALLEVERADEAGIRPFELQERLLLPQYGTSRLLDRLDAAGLIWREECAEDGRGQVIHITAKGRALRRRMWPVYAAELRGMIEEAIAPCEAEALAATLARLVDAAGKK